MNYSILSSMVRPSTAQVAYDVSYTTTLLGTIERSTIMNLTLEEGSWQVQWDASMILPELAGGNKLELTYEIRRAETCMTFMDIRWLRRTMRSRWGSFPGR